MLLISFRQQKGRGGLKVIMHGGLVVNGVWLMIMMFSFIPLLEIPNEILNLGLGA